MGKILYFCRSCGTCFSGEDGLENESCPECGKTDLIDTGVSREQWRSMSAKEQEYAKTTWMGNRSLSIKKCVKCGMNIPYVALKCPYCRSRLSKGNGLSLLLRVLVTIVLLCIVMGVIVNTSSSHSSSSNTESILINKAANMTIEEYKREAISVSYDELKRNPDTYKGKYIIMQLYVVQIIGDKDWRAYTYENSLWTKYNTDEEFYIIDKRTTGTNVIENDVITVYGVYNGTVSVKRAITGTKEKIPAIAVYKLELN